MMKTKTQQSAGMGNGAKGPRLTCSVHTEQIAPNLMCNNGTKPNNQQGSDRRRWVMKTKTQQSAEIQRRMDDDNSTINREGKEDKGFNVLT
eukprot:1139182-Ditylum_brightwellii.AAC.1